MDEGIKLTEGDVARIGIMKGLGEFADLVIYDSELSMEDIKLKAEKFGIKEGQKFFDWIQELRDHVLNEESDDGEVSDCSEESDSSEESD